MLRLEIEPIPFSSWGMSLANKLPPEEWKELRDYTFKISNYKCQICQATMRPLHCHEVWEFNDREKIQKLKALECLCEMCHNVKHLGYSKSQYPKKYIDQLIEHWCRVNKKTLKDFEVYENKIWKQNRRRQKNFYLVKVGNRLLS